MITQLLIEYRALVPAALFLTAICCFSVGYLLVRSRRHGRRLLWVLTAVSALVVLALTIAPLPGAHLGPMTCTVQFDYPTLGRVELVANVAVFFPLAYFATLATRRPALTLAVLSATSAVIEIAQAIVLALGRACDTNDWLMNTIGAVAGVLAAVITLAVARRVDARRAAAPGPHAA